MGLNATESGQQRQTGVILLIFGRLTGWKYKCLTHACVISCLTNPHAWQKKWLEIGANDSWIRCGQGVGWLDMRIPSCNTWITHSITNSLHQPRLWITQVFVRSHWYKGIVRRTHWYQLVWKNTQHQFSWHKCCLVNSHKASIQHQHDDWQTISIKPYMNGHQLNPTWMAQPYMAISIKPYMAINPTRMAQRWLSSDGNLVLAASCVGLFVKLMAQCTVKASQPLATGSPPGLNTLAMP